MVQGEDQNSILLYGRDFTEEELKEVEETVHLFPKLTQTELAHTICELLNWKSPSGKNKVDPARKLLDFLEAQDRITLPQKKHSAPKKKEKVVLSDRTSPEKEVIGSVGAFEPIELEPVMGSEAIGLWNEYVERYHVLGYKRPFGAHQRYFIVLKAEPTRRLGCLLFSAAAWALASRDEWIGWTEEDRKKRLYLVLNNTRFLVFPWVRVKNLASKVLSIAIKQVPLDWEARYNYRPVLLETFVDNERYLGTSYKAANWILLGETTGRGRMDRYNQGLSTPKLIYVYPLVDDFRSFLRGERDVEELFTEEAFDNNI